MKKQNPTIALSSLTLAAALFMGSNAVYANDHNEPVANETVETVIEEALDNIVPVEEALENVASTEEVAQESSQAADHTTAEKIVEESPVEFHVSEDIEAITLSPEDLIGYGKQIIEVLDSRLSWSDIPVVLEMSAKMVGHISQLSVEQKRDTLIEVLNYVIDHTNTPWLPDRLTDPIFKSMVPPFANMLVSEKFITEVDFSFPQELVENQDFEGAAELLRQRFAHGFRWSDLTFAVGAAFSFGAQLDDLSWESREQVMSEIVDFVIDKTNTPWLPDRFSDPIFKAFARSTIHVLVVSKQNEEQGTAE